MMQRWQTFSKRRALRRGATLIEVMAGLVVLGVLVASIVIARGRAARQWADAERRIVAARALDAMITHWFDADSIPLSGGGNLEGAPGCVWRRAPTWRRCIRRRY